MSQAAKEGGSPGFWWGAGQRYKEMVALDDLKSTLDL